MKDENKNENSLIKSVRKLTLKKDGTPDDWHALV